MSGRVPNRPPPSSPPVPAASQGEEPCDVDFNPIDRAGALFEAAFPATALPATWSHGNRTFSIHDHLGFMLLGLYVPTCGSLRGLCEASELEQFKERCGCFAMLLQLRTGTRPTKRMIELLHFYAQGMVSETEPVNGLKARAREADLARESSRKRYLAKKQAAQK